MVNRIGSVGAINAAKKKGKKSSNSNSHNNHKSSKSNPQSASGSGSRSPIASNQSITGQQTTTTTTTTTTKTQNSGVSSNSKSPIHQSGKSAEKTTGGKKSDPSADAAAAKNSEPGAAKKSSQEGGLTPAEVKKIASMVPFISQSLYLYGIDLYNITKPLKAKTGVIKESGKEQPVPNFCVNPLQIIRAYGLLSNIAVGKTFEDILTFIETLLRTRAVSGLMDAMLAFYHDEHVNKSEGCVRLFTDMQPHVSEKSKVFQQIWTFFSDESGRCPLQNLVFSTDPDGLYSTFRINEEMARSTKNHVRYVVPEEFAPNWNSSIVLASCSDGSFLPKLEKYKISHHTMKFYDSRGATADIKCYHMKGKFKVSRGSSRNIIQLEGEDEKFALYLIDGGNLDESDFLTVAAVEKWQEEELELRVPQTIISTPISLFEPTKQSGLRRIFNSDKSELCKMHSYSDEKTTNFVTLWDHYHKTLFQILSKPYEEPITPEKLKVAPFKAHECSDNFLNCSSDDRGHEGYDFPDDDSDDAYDDYCSAYYEKHLGHQVWPNKTVAESPPIGVVEQIWTFDKCFSFIVTRMCAGKPLLHCMGVFNNTPLVENQEEGCELKERKVSGEGSDE